MTLVVWDWNGTLLDDVEISYSIFAEFLAAQRIVAPSLEIFRTIYRHPIIEMYQQVGYSFQQESFEEMSARWYETYLSRSKEAKIFSDVQDALEAFRALPAEQLIISALQHDALQRQVLRANLQPHFIEVSGHHDQSADSKVGRALSVINRYKDGRKREVLVLGDTSHDAEMARAAEAHCILIARGHEDRGRLEQTGFPVVENLIEATTVALDLIQ